MIRQIFAVIDESEDWIVVEKPAHLLVHPTKPDGPFTLWNGLRQLLAFELANGGQISIINRLDRETSGLILVAKHTSAARDLARWMQQRRIAKEYLAVVWGWPEADEFAINAPILRQGSKMESQIHLKQMVHPEGAVAVTRFRIEKRFLRSGSDPFSVIRAFPETGRTHQIRVHLAHAGFPIVGDKIYGPDEECYLRFIETGWTPELQTRLLLPRHALHSAGLAIPHVNLEWRSDLPADLLKFKG
ncbi:MAG TPA: RNA pseudouridine synthase [Chthoniobacterales bacterium]